MTGRKLKLKGILEAGHEEFFYSESDNSVAPADGFWRIPVDMTLDIPIIDAASVTQAMTMVYENDDGSVIRKTEFFADRSTGALYTSPISEGKPSLSSVILYEAQYLIGRCDKPKALKGFPWNCKSTKEAETRIAENLRNLIPKLARDFSVTTNGLALEASPGPYWYATSWREGELVLLTDEKDETTGGYSRSFDYADRKGLESFIRVLDEMGDRDSSEEINKVNRYLIEHEPGFVPQDRFGKFVKSLSLDLMRYLVDTPVPDEIRGKISALSTISDTPDKKESESIYQILRDVETFLNDADIQTKGDYVRDVSQLQIAVIRAGHRAGYEFKINKPENSPSP